MSYEIRQTPEVTEKMRSWKLPKSLLDELRFRLAEDLSEQPAPSLHSVPNYPDYLEYSFASETVHEGCNYLFVFRIVYSRDRSALVLLDADFLPVPD